MLEDTRTRHYFFAIIFITTIVLSFMVVLPYLTTLALAAIFAVIFRPFYLWLLKKITKRETLAALITMFLVLILIVTPMVLLSLRIISEEQQLYASLVENDSISNFTLGLVEYLEDTVGVTLSADVISSFDITAYVQPVVQWVVGNFGSIFSSIARLALQFVIGSIAFFFLLTDGKKLKKYLMYLSPLQDSQDSKVFDTMRSSINSVVRGALVIAIVQGIVAGVGYAIFGLPNASLWGSVTAISALIPGIGTALVMIPAIMFLFIFGSWPAAIGLAIWGFLAVGLVDNIIGPKIWGRGIKVHTLLILVSVLGGIQLFGPVGFILGPLILSLLFALLELYPIVFKKS